MKYKLTFALVAALTSTAFAAFQAPLPEFKNEKQLAEWRAEKASEATGQGYAAEETAFYTGKPFLASSGGYAFRYRSYNPELARWTTEDPSGFPDGANQLVFAPCPTSECDPTGLATQQIHSNLSVQLIVDKLNSITEGQGWAQSIVQGLATQALVSLAGLHPKYTGEYQWNTDAHTVKVNANPGQEGLSSGGVKFGDIGLNVAVEFKFFLPDPERGTGPAMNLWHYKGEGYWMLNLTGSIGGSFEIVRPPDAKLDQWHE